MHAGFSGPSRRELPDARRCLVESVGAGSCPAGSRWEPESPQRSWLRSAVPVRFWRHARRRADRPRCRRTRLECRTARKAGSSDRSADATGHAAGDSQVPHRRRRQLQPSCRRIPVERHHWQVRWNGRERPIVTDDDEISHVCLPRLHRHRNQRTVGRVLPRLGRKHLEPRIATDSLSSPRRHRMPGRDNRAGRTDMRQQQPERCGQPRERKPTLSRSMSTAGSLVLRHFPRRPTGTDGNPTTRTCRALHRHEQRVEVGAPPAGHGGRRVRQFRRWRLVRTVGVEPPRRAVRTTVLLPDVVGRVELVGSYAVPADRVDIVAGLAVQGRGGGFTCLGCGFPNSRSV